ncbi:MAG: hypothetical protein JO252_10695 [Planctomycetaceae bacterium]|nr:hypothetical protein [Planctomycetaceae bacterium]
MRKLSWPTLAILATAIATGCQSGTFGRKQNVAAREPGLSSAVEPGKVVLDPPATATRTVTFVDRHPLLWKPRDYYENSGSNPVVKTAAATMIGIPAGIFGELRQIVVGAPTEQRIGSRVVKPVGTTNLPPD